MISQKQVSATLGKESLDQGLIAGIVGLALVMLFLIAYYRFLGVIAALGLVIYAILLYAVVVLVPITLTLPGIAGIILTIGVASDANVVIFERVREEARAGKTPRAAILAGYKKGITAIIDANVVTLATAAILFLFATAGVKGFAFTLIDRRPAVAVHGRRGDAGHLQRAGRDALPARRPLHGPEAAGDPLEDGLRRQVEAVDGDLVRADRHRDGLHRHQRPQPRARLRERHPHGSALFERQASEDDVRAVFEDLGYTTPRSRHHREDRRARGPRLPDPDRDAPAAPAVQELRRALDAEFGIDGRRPTSWTLVGPTFGRQIIRNAIYAILLSFAVIVIYLTHPLRVQARAAGPALGGPRRLAVDRRSTRSPAGR